jgi:RNA polymerase sigma-70 factor (ECF subfamily)
VSAAAEPSDAEVIRRAQGGDHDAFRVLVERYQGRAYRLARRVLRDDEQAKDAVQEAFLKVYASLRRFEGRSSFYTWLYRLVLNLCLDMRRRDRSDRHVEWDDARRYEATDALPTPAAADFAPSDALLRKELRERLADAVAQLPDAARETLLLREVEGLSYAEIAEALGVPKGTVMSRLHYARKRVQNLLLDAELVEGGSAPAQPEASEGEDRT